ncbi:Ig-like domain-containing protein, partial [Chitinivorax sp. B]|uniref:Ig-like domain-containing protein n=1 Tax=Chitinivorax sp. B TaxID=2502235 RepID=UPI001485058A
LEAALKEKGIESRYGLVGYAYNQPDTTRQVTVGGAQFGSASQFAPAALGLRSAGSMGPANTYAAIELALTYSFRDGVARNLILYADSSMLPMSAWQAKTAELLAKLKSTKTRLNAVLTNRFYCGDGTRALGMGGNGVGYVADGVGGVKTCQGARAGDTDFFIGGVGSAPTALDSIFPNEIKLALESGGTVWDASLSFADTATTQSFTNAFVRAKVAEIEADQPPPTVERCDVNADKTIDKTDIDLIFKARNQKASSATDPRDADADGTVTVLDARICTLKCSLANCAINGVPTVGADAYSLTQASTLSIAKPGVLANDKDPEGKPLTAKVVSNVANGSLVLNGDGSFSYTPFPNFVGKDSFTYRANDGLTDSAVTTVSLTVTAGNRPPIANGGADRSVTVATTVTLDGKASSDPDGDGLTYTWALISRPAGSMAALSATNAATSTFKPDVVGDYLVQLVVHDGKVSSAPATIKITAKDGAAIVGISLAPADTKLAQGATRQYQVMGKLANGGSREITDGVSWSSSDAAVVSISTDGLATGLVQGAATLTAKVDGFAATLSVSVEPAGTFPTAIIKTPEQDTTISRPIDMMGTATDADFSRYTIAVAAKGSGHFKVVATGDTPVVNGVLTKFDPSTLANGLYDVRLEVEDALGQKTRTETSYEVVGDLKVGNFTVTFQDLSIDASGIPITVNRTYDTRRSGESLDFGYGWSVDYQNIRIQANRKLGTSWMMSRTSGPFPTYCIKPVGKHFVSITLPDGKVEKFDMGTNPSCANLVPPSYVKPAFTAAAGTRSKLVAEDVGDLRFAGDLLYDMGTGEAYNPSRFTLTTQEGFVYELDKEFGIRTVTDPNGNKLTYSASGILHSAGLSVQFVRDNKGRIVEVIDPTGKKLTYAYDKRGDLHTVTDRTAAVASHTYNLSHGLLDYTDPRGVLLVRNEYDAAGRLVAQIDAKGHRIEATHDTANKVEVIKDRRGNATTYLYDDNGNILKQTDALGGVTEYTYDAHGNELTKKDALGHVITRVFDARDNLLSETDAQGRTATYTYDASDRATTVTDAKGNVSNNTYDSVGNLTQIKDALGQVTRVAYSGKGDLASLTDAAGNSTSFSYDSKGNRLSETDALGNVTTFTYDSNGRELTRTVKRSTGSGVESLTSSKTYDASGNVLTETDVLGRKQTHEYNRASKVVATIDAKGLRTEYQYDTRGYLVLTRFPDGTTEAIDYDANGNKVAMVDRGGRTTSYEYDALNRLTKTVLPDGSMVASTYDAVGNKLTDVDGKGSTTTYQYDASNRQIAVIDALGSKTQFGYDANGNQISVIDAAGNETKHEYDAANRRVKTVLADGSSIQFEYDQLGRKLAETDQAGLTTRWAYDKLSRLIEVTDALGGKTRYSYDELGNKLSQTDALGRVTNWAYDGAGRVLQRTLPEGMTERFTYDVAGNMASRTDFNGKTTTYVYDINNRLTEKNEPITGKVRYSYTAAGQLATVTDDRGITKKAYDHQDRLIRVDNPDGSFIAYTYDKAGNRTEVQTSRGTTRYEFDVLNRLVKVIDNGGKATQYAYDAVGNQVAVVYPNGTEARYTYNKLGRLTRLAHTRKTDNTVLASFDYTLSPSGQRTKIVEANGRTSSYVYDALGRLTNENIADSVNGNHVASYSYDAVGNRIAQSANGINRTSVYDKNDRLLSDGKATYVYDANGNTTSKTEAGKTVTYQYSTENRLIGFDSIGTSVRYAYDAEGNRVSQTVNGSAKTSWLVDANRDYA